MTKQLLIWTVALCLIVGIVYQQTDSVVIPRTGNHITQSTPFENILLAMKTDSIPLFLSAFSNRIIDGENDKLVWKKRLNEGKEKFRIQFDNFQLKDFTFEYDEKESKLIIYFKGKEVMRMKVIKEDEKWKLDEK